MSASEILYRVFVLTHLLAGVAALAVFWVPALVRKGGKLHRALGKVFMVLMSTVIITGIPLGARMLLQGHRVSATFILYLGVITTTAVGAAWFALKLKRDPARYYGSTFRNVAVLNLLSGALVIALGYLNSAGLLFGFGFVGVFIGIDMLKRYRLTERAVNWWLIEHLGGMIGAGIAAHVAFGAFGLRRLWPAYASVDGWVGLVPWFAPVVIGVVASIFLEKKYSNGVPRKAVA